MKITFIIIVGIILLAAIIYSTIAMKNQSNKSKQNDTTHTEGTLFYHEDDFCQIQLIPFENFNELIKQAENIDEFAEKHFDGTGYTDIKIREENTVKLSDKHIIPAELDSILNNLGVVRHQEVNSGYGSTYRVKSKNTIGYGFGYSAIYYDFQNDCVKNIWMTSISDLDKEKVSTVLNKIGSKWNLLLMDWNSLQLIDLKNIKQINNYLE